MRILQVSAFYAGHGGGIEVVADQLARRLAEKGHEVRWMAGGAASEMPEAVPQGLTCLHAASWDPLEKRLGLPFPLWSPGAVRALWRSVRWSQSVQVHDYLYGCSLLAIVFARLMRKPVVLTQHIGAIPFRSMLPRQLLALLNRSLGALALRSVHQVVFVGRPVMQFFMTRVRFGRPPLLLPNGVDHQRYRPAPFQPRSAGDAVRLLFVGRFVEKKGLQHLRASAQLQGAHWTFIGSGPAGPATWSEIDRRNIDLPGRLPPEEVVAHYQSAALLVLPSTGEGFPLVLQEALACGTPVLVSTEVHEAFPSSDPRCVFHVEMRGSDAAVALRLKLQALISDPQLLIDARDHAAELSRQWNWDECAVRYEALHLAAAGLYGRPADAP